MNAHDVMVELSGVATGSLPVILADRIARTVELHAQSPAAAECAECFRAWPCATYKILTGHGAR